jgi:hypothetical protein
MKKFDFRKLMVISYWWCIKKNKEFNAFVFYVDLLIWVLPISFLLAVVFINVL